VQPRIKQGFEMLINNFSLGILGAILLVMSLFIIAPIVTYLTELLGMGVETLISANLLFLTSIIIEPAKILFLNNAINHGVLTPLGASAVVESGKSILFLLETNPGPGLGVLLAYAFFGTGLSRSTAPAAIIIQFFGGIHEIYFPYVLMRPLLVLAVIGGGMAGVATFSLLDAGLVAPASPGSIFAIAALAAPDDLFKVLLGVAVSAVVTFFIAAAIIKLSPDIDELGQAVEKTSKLKNKESRASMLVKDQKDKINVVRFACAAGMGSSAMGASIMKKVAKDAGKDDLDIANCSLKNLPENVQLVITQATFADTARSFAPNAEIILVDNFLDKKRYEDIIKDL